MIDTSVSIIGLYGCYCHPYKSWDELKWYERQKFNPGDVVMFRHTREFGFVLNKEEGVNYYRVNVLPCKVASDITISHVSCLIPKIKFSTEELEIFNNSSIQ